MSFRHFRILLVLAIVATTLHGPTWADPQRIDLAGRWGFRLDPENQGRQQGWFNEKLSDAVQLPGTLDENRKGTPNTAEPQFKLDNLKRLSRKHEYTGKAWYQRQISIPSDWSGKRITLTLERVIWESTVWIDDHPIGMQDSLVAPHVHDITELATPGKHTMTIVIDNSYKYNVGTKNDLDYSLAHAYTNETQTIWNGVIGEISLQATDRVYVDDVQVYPDLANRSAKVHVTLKNRLGEPAQGKLALRAKSSNSSRSHATARREVDFTINATEETITIDLPMGEYLAWDEFSPALYDLEVACNGKEFENRRTVRFGMREFKADKTVFTINDRRVFLRGTLECAIFPLTGHPPMDVQAWSRILSIARAHGLNHLRFHSWCPPGAAFEAADRAGFYFQVELPVWIDNAGEDPERDRFITEEGYRMLKQYGNHPSFCLFSMGNEIHGDFDFLHALVADLRARDSRHLYTSTTYTFQWPHGQWPEEGDDYFITQETKKGWVRGQGYVNDNRPSTDYDYQHAMEGLEVPLVTHEIGQATVYPNMEEIAKYTGVLKPLNLMAVKKDLTEKGLLRQAPDFTRSTGQFAVGLYKAEIELALRTRGTTGFQLLDLHDFPGQGTALIGVLDPFWDSKGLITPEGFRRFCSTTVPLARMPKRVYENNETFEAEVEVAHFGPKPLQQAQAVWTLTDSRGKELAAGTLPPRDIPLGNCIELGSVSVALGRITNAERLNLEVRIQGTDAANDWNIWVYPAKLQTPVPDDIVVASSLHKQVLDAIEAGKKILFLPKRALIKDKIPGRYTPVFWSPVLFTGQPGTMGILCDPKHPALERFPTDYHSDWQWWDLNINSVVMNLDSLPAEVEAIVQIVDNFSRNHRLAVVFELNVGRAKMIVASVDLTDDLDASPQARQLRHSLIAYMQSAAFAPRATVDLARLASLFHEAMPLTDATVLHVDSAHPGYPAEAALDNDPKTFWHTRWAPEIAKYPHEIVIDLGREMEIKGFTYLTRQDGSPNGRVAEYQFYISNDKDHWGKPAAEGAFAEDDSRKKVMFDTGLKGRYLRFVAKKGFDDDHHTAVAELGIVTE